MLMCFDVESLDLGLKILDKLDQEPVPPLLVEKIGSQIRKLLLRPDVVCRSG